MAIVSFAGESIKWNSVEDAVDIVNELQITKDVRCLKLEGNTLGVEAAEVIGDALANHPEFEKAHWKDLFTGRLKTEIPQALKHLFSGIMRAGAKLKELDLSDNALGPIGVEGMVDFIRSPSCYLLEEIRLNNNGLGIKGGTMLAEALMELAVNAAETGRPLHLKVFICGRNRLENEGAQIFAQFFSMVKSLEEVEMPQNGIFLPGISALADAMSENENLRILNLNDNTFTAKGADVMSKQLPKMSNLEVVNFGDCLVKSRGAIAIVESLSNSQNLKELYLDSNEIGPLAISAIVETVQKLPQICYLMLDCNQFGEEGLELLAEMLEECGKADILGPTDEDDSDDEDYEEEDGEVNSEYEEECSDDDSVRSEEYISPLKRYVSKVPECENFKNISLEEFLSQPAASKILQLPENTSEMLKESHSNINAKNLDSFEIHGEMINVYTTIFMNIASYSDSNDAKVIERVHFHTENIATEVFRIARENDMESIAANSLLVHFGLIKAEDKKFKITWSLGAALNCLIYLVDNKVIPKNTVQTLQFFVSRPGPILADYPQEKHRLLTALFKV